MTVVIGSEEVEIREGGYKGIFHGFFFYEKLLWLLYLNMHVVYSLYAIVGFNK